MRLKRKVVGGHWKDENVHQKINVWARAAAGGMIYKSKICTFW